VSVCVTGGLLKKTLLSAAAMTAAAAVCYPREATDISKYSWNVASDFASSTYYELFDCKTACHLPFFTLVLLMQSVTTDIFMV